VKNAVAPTAVRPDRVAVTVRGPQLLIESLVLNEEHVSADATGQGAGSITVPVAVALPPGVELVSQDPEKVELQLVEDNKKKLPIVEDNKKKLPKPRTGGKIQTSGVH
jgi:YbbR domain-containing protein